MTGGSRSRLFFAKQVDLPRELNPAKGIGRTVSSSSETAGKEGRIPSHRGLQVLPPPRVTAWWGHSKAEQFLSHQPQKEGSSLCWSEKDQHFPEQISASTTQCRPKHSATSGFPTEAAKQGALYLKASGVYFHLINNSHRELSYPGISNPPQL